MPKGITLKQSASVREDLVLDLVPSTDSLDILRSAKAEGVRMLRCNVCCNGTRLLLLSSFPAWKLHGEWHLDVR